MEFTTTTAILLELFSKVQAGLSERATLPIVTKIRIGVEKINKTKSRLVMHTTDLEMYLKAETEIPTKDVEHLGACLISGKDFEQIIKAIDEEDKVTISYDESIISTSIKTSSGGNFTLAGVHVQEYPSDLAEKNIEPDTIELGAKQFSSLLERVVFCVSQDELRPALCGVFMEVAGDKLTICATDGHRLAEIIVEGKVTGSPSLTAVLPPKAAKVIIDCLKDVDNQVTLLFGGGYIGFTVPGMSLTSRLIEGKYPHYKSIIPLDNKNTLTLSPAPFLKAIKRAEIMSNPISHLIELHLDKLGVTMTANDPEFGKQAKDSGIGAFVTYDGEPLDVGFNSKYLAGIMRRIVDETAIIKFGSDTTAVTFTGEGLDVSEKVTMLCMPCRLKA